MGSKNRIAKYLLPIILKDRKENQWYVEPFVGGANMIDKVTGLRIGADYDKDVINALKLIRDNIDLLPKNNKEFTEQDYYKIKKDPNHILHGYVAFTLSYGGKKWSGWRRDKQGIRDYVAEAYKNALKQHKKLQGVKLIHADYKNLQIPDNSIIYCDPPYANTTKYKTNFNHNDFWEWCRKKVKEGHKVFVSEYNAPDDFICIWQKEIVSSLTKNTGAKKGIEKLFVHKSQL
jgi:DNA adenine methylase